jgi:CHAD domain-containing protein
VGVAAAAGVSFGGDQHMLAESGQLMTTDRTTIRRRLAVGRTAHRPPWRGRKAGHRSIVAPLGATLAASIAATVFVGVGAALARAERDRRSSRARQARERRFALLAGEQPVEGLRRMAVGQLDRAIELLSREGGRTTGERAVHETRKALKRLRTLLALLADAVDERTLSYEQEAVRQAARRLSGVRDAEVMVQTLDALLERHPRKLRRKSVRRLRERFEAERRRAAAHTGDPATRAEVIAQLRGARVRIERWTLPRGRGLRAIEPGLERIYRQGRKRCRRAARGKGETAQAMHEWRKRVKDLRYTAEALGPAETAGKPGNSCAGEGARSLRRLAKRADELGELLGDDHDLAVLAERVRAQGRRHAGPHAPIGRGAERTLLKLIARRRRHLRKIALRQGKRLYSRRPKTFVRRVRRACR